MILALLAAASFQPTATLDRAVAAFTGHAIGDEGGARAAVDPRLRLAACPTVALSWRSAAQDAVVVTCAGPDWRIFVPVKRAAPVVPAAATPATAATPLARPVPVVRRGDPVLIEAAQDGFSITRQGVAAADAAIGARVAVRVEGAVQPVQAVATGDGRVTLPGYAN
jgi:flagella basal body P-ring formation protein FlgA